MTNCKVPSLNKLNFLTFRRVWKAWTFCCFPVPRNSCWGGFPWCSQTLQQSRTLLPASPLPAPATVTCSLHGSHDVGSMFLLWLRCRVDAGGSLPPQRRVSSISCARVKLSPNWHRKRILDPMFVDQNVISLLHVLWGLPSRPCIAEETTLLLGNRFWNDEKHIRTRNRCIFYTPLLFNE